MPIVAAGEPPGALSFWPRRHAGAPDGSRRVELAARSIPPGNPFSRRVVPQGTFETPKAATIPAVGDSRLSPEAHGLESATRRRSVQQQSRGVPGSATVDTPMGVVYTICGIYSVSLLAERERDPARGPVAPPARLGDGGGGERMTRRGGRDPDDARFPIRRGGAGAGAACPDGGKAGDARGRRKPNRGRDAAGPDIGTGRGYAEIRDEAVGANRRLRFRPTGPADRTFAGDGPTADARLDVAEMVFGIHRGLAIGGAGR